MADRVIAIVPSAGIGKRFGPGYNKPFEILGGRPVIIWTLEALDRMPEISEIIPVMKEKDMQPAGDLFKHYGIKKIQRIAPGGKERQDSVYNGLHFIGGEQPVVIVHDGVRPFLDHKTVRMALEALPGHDGVVVGVPPKDTIKEIDGDQIIKTLKRDSLFAVQTPQVFYFRPLLDAYEKAMKDSYYATDDAALVEWNGGCVATVRSEYTNIKITTPEDIVVAEAILKLRGER